MSEREILDQLIAKGKITEEDISELLTPAKKELVGILHLMMCGEDHDCGDLKLPHICRWYPEEQLDNTWERSTHTQWTERADDILRRFNLTVNRTIYDLNEIRVVVGKATAEGWMELLRFILSSDSTKFIPESTTKDSTSSSDDPSLSS